MIIKVKNPDRCPLRQCDEEACMCNATRSPSGSILICDNNENFPKDCPLNSRTIVIEKAEEDEELYPDGQMTALVYPDGQVTALGSADDE